MIRIENKTGIPHDTKIIDTETGNDITCDVAKGDEP